VRCIPLCSLVLLISLVPGALAQIPLENGESHFLAPLTKISKVVNEVDLAFTVTDKKGRFISDLQATDFALLDNNTAPDRLTFFQQRSDLPLHLAILIDASDSVKFRFKFEQKAAFSFVKKIVRAKSDEVFVVTFNDQVKTVQEVTEKKARISKALKTTNAHGDTALYDAIIYASEKLRQIPEHQLTRRGIILLSDGFDTVHRSTLDEAKEAAARAGVMVFSVSTNFFQDDSNEAGDRTLKDLAESTGGMFLSGGDEDKIRDAFHDVEKALRHQYVVAYNPASFLADGSYHTVEVVPRKHGLRANCRKGYYAIVRAFH
jgi:Ca-activated chloride channel family protein